MRIRLESRRMYYGHKILTKETPNWVIWCRANSALVAKEDLGGFESSRATSKDCTISHKCSMSSFVGSDENGRTRPDMESNNRAILGTQMVENGLNISEVARRFEKPIDVP
ncbi:unnamed protein product [Prunus brigantina]